VRQEPDIVGVVALLVAALVLGSACGGPGDDPAERSPDTRAPVGAAELAGRTFVSTGVTEQGEPRPLVADTRISIEFEGATVRWDAGCNLFGAAYRIDAGRLVFTEGYGGTAMGCLPQPRADQDEWLASLMAAEPGLALGRDTLTVSSDHTVIVLVDEDSATTDAELVGTTWTLDTIVEGDTASSVPTGVSATLVFGADGSVVGTDDCNGYGGRYSVEGDVLVVVPADDSTARAARRPAGSSRAPGAPPWRARSAGPSRATGSPSRAPTATGSSTAPTAEVTPGREMGAGRGGAGWCDQGVSAGIAGRRRPPLASVTWSAAATRRSPTARTSAPERGSAKPRRASTRATSPAASNTGALIVPTW
jgi:heat shock protein HslJ